MLESKGCESKYTEDKVLNTKHPRTEKMGLQSNQKNISLHISISLKPSISTIEKDSRSKLTSFFTALRLESDITIELERTTRIADKQGQE